MDEETLKYYEDYYFANSLPVPFCLKENNFMLNIRPITVGMFPFYRDNMGILLIDKNKVNDINIISMSYLQYLVDIVLKQKEYQRALVTVLDLSLGDEYVYTMGHYENGKPYIGIQDQDGKMLSRISAKEFDKISKIIIFYNDRNYDDRYISDDMRKAMEEYNRIRLKDTYMPTLEEKKAFVSFKSGLTQQQLNDMSYRYFDIMYDQCVANDLFFSQKIIQASEKYKVNEDEIVYPLFKKKDNKFDFLQNADTWEKKVSAAAKGSQ